MAAREDADRAKRSGVWEQHLFSRDRTTGSGHDFQAGRVPTEPKRRPSSVRAVEGVAVGGPVGHFDVLLTALATDPH